MALCSKSWTDINIDFGERKIKHCCKATSEQYSALDTNFINNSPILLERREQSLQNIQHPQCAYCWKSNSAYRNIYNKQLDYNKNADQLVEFIELKFDNVCNLGCVYCSEIDSSTIAKEKQLEKFITKHNPNDVEIVTNYIKSLNKKIQINMLGGEPTLSKGYHQFIKSLIETDASNNNITLITTSNGNMHQHILSTLLKYMECTNWNWVWGFSGESTEDIFANVRHGADWQQWNNNLNTLSAHKNTSIISFNPTVNLLTVKDLPNYIKCICKIDKIFMLNGNFVLEPTELSIAKAPRSFIKYVEQSKEIFAQNKNMCANNQQVYKWFDSLINIIGTQMLDTKSLSSFLEKQNKQKNYTLDTALLMEQTYE